MGARAQFACPSLNFLDASTVNLTPSATSHIDVVRQSDGSYTGFEVTNAAPFRTIATTPHFEKQFAACLPHTLPASPRTTPPNANPGGAGSQLQVSMILPSGSLFLRGGSQRDGGFAGEHQKSERLLQIQADSGIGVAEVTD